jgi:hypothetical protein
MSKSKWKFPLEIPSERHSGRDLPEPQKVTDAKLDRKAQKRALAARQKAQNHE